MPDTLEPRSTAVWKHRNPKGTMITRRCPLVAAALAAGALALTGVGGAFAATATRIGPDGGPATKLVSLPRVLLVTSGDGGYDAAGGFAGNAWASYDHGRSWVLGTRQQADVLNAADRTDGGWSNPETLHDPRRRNVVYDINSFSDIGGVAVRVSSDGGRHFVKRGRIPTVSTEEMFTRTTLLGTTPRTTLLVAIDKAFAFTNQPPELWRSLDAGRTWRRVTTLPGSVRTFWPHPARPKVVFATTEVGENFEFRLYRSRNAGATWTRIGAGLRTPPSPGGLAISRRRPSHLLTISSNSIMSSSDSGSTWTRRGTFSGLSGIVIDAGTDSTAYAMNSMGVVRSTDDGRTWQQVNRGRRAIEATDIAISGVNVLLASQTPPYLSSSNDGGTTWTFPKLDRGTQGVSDVAIDSVDANRIAVIGPDLIQSIDGAATWQPTGIDAFFLTQDRVSGAVYTFANNVLLKSPRAGDPYTAVSSPLPGPRVVVVAGSSIYLLPYFDATRIRRSFNGGRTWSWTARLPFQADSIEAAPSAPNEVYAFQEWSAELRRSSDGGTTWHQPALRGLPKHPGISSLMVDRTDPAHLFVGLYSSGIWTSHDRGETWVRLSVVPRRVSKIKQDPLVPTRLFVATTGFGVWRIDGAR